MKTAVYCVTYNSYHELYKYLESISLSAANAGMNVDVFVADNTEDSPQTISYKSENVNMTVFPLHRNIGYFGAIGQMMKTASPYGYDLVFISNVDIEFTPELLTQLSLIDFGQGRTGWIAPCIFSNLEQRDRNPKIMNRYSISRIRTFKLLFQFPIVFRFYQMTLYKRKKLQHHAAGHIYAGHGSCFILTGAYFDACGTIDYPVFLYGEEIYVAENCLSNGLTVDYMPELKVLDGEHVSTGKMKKSLYFECNFRAMSYILDKYYHK